MKSNLFNSAPRGRGMDNAVVGGTWARRYAYVNGYYVAAETLSKSALGTGPQDLLFYPICYNYRHAIELHLKAIVTEAERCHEKLVELGEKVDDLPAKPRGLMGKHRLADLLEHIETQLMCFTEEVIDAEVKASILNLDDVDFDGQAFRYDQRRDGSQSLPEIADVDIRNFATLMEKVRWHLVGIDSWLGERRMLAESIIDDFIDHYA